MEKKTASAIMLTLLLTGMLTLAFNIQPAKASETIYIRADGSIDPPTAPIQREGDSYVFTANINDSVVVKRSNVIVDGAGYTLQGSAQNGMGIILLGRVNVTIKNIEIRTFDIAIFLNCSSNNTISGNNITNNNVGIDIYNYSSSNNVSGNNITNNKAGITIHAGELLWPSSSNNNSISENKITANSELAIQISGSSGNNVSRNNITNNKVSIDLQFSNNNIIAGNSLTGPNYYGLGILCSHSNSILGNMFVDAGLWVSPDYLSSYENVVVDNLVNGKPLLYLEGISNRTIENAGQVILINCTSIRMANLNLSNTHVGIELCGTHDCTISGSNITNNSVGIWLYSSPNNRISGNRIAYNIVGIWPYVYLSTSNSIYHNSFISNVYQVYEHAFPNVWDDGYPSGGNYWSDYTDVDLNNDGIWDHPYVIDAYNQDHYPLVNPWTPIPPNQPPNCIVRLQKDGIEITEIGVEQFFDIYVGASSDDTGISQVRFSNDDVRDGRPTGRWTEWYEWDISSDDWDATTKIRRWAFYTPGYKEVWEELKDTKSQTGSGSASIYAPAPAMPVLTTPLTITPAKDMYLVGDSLSAGFTIKNIGETPITLDVLTVGGRVNGRIVDGYPDFTHRQVTLQPGVPYEYTGSLVLDQTGSYRFFIAFYIANPTLEEKKLLDQNNWNTCVELGEGLSQTDRVKNTIVFEEGTLPEDVSQLRDMINRLKRQSVWIPDNLLGVDSFTEQVATVWAGWTAWATQTDLTEKYYELYYAGLDYYRLRLNALVSAGSFLDHGDLDSAKRYVAKSRTYEKLAHMSFAGSIEVFDGNIQAGQILAEGIKDGCEAAATFGIEVTWPAAAPAVDAVYMGFDFAINTWIEGVDQATIDLATELVVKAIFQNVQFTSLDGTLEDYVNRVGTSTPLDSLLGNEEFMTEFGNELKTVIEDRIINQGIITISEYTLEKIVNAAIQDFRSHGNSQKIDVQSPVGLRVVDSIGQVTGLVNGRLRQDIPMSMYYDETVTIFSPSDIYTYEVVGKDNGVYGLIINLTDDGNTTTFNATRIPISLSELHVYTVDWGNVTSGEVVTVQVDSDGDGTFEYNFTSDNELNRTEYVAATTQHDIEITGITTSKNVVGQGYNLLINATIMNYGVYTEVFNVTSYVNTTLITSQTIVLASGSFTTITFTWNTTGFAYGNYTLWSYAEPVQGETFTSDNNSTDGWVTVTILGDVNGDFKCEGKDIAIIAKAYGSLEGQAGYVPNADINDDGRIDGKDIAVAAKYYGTHYP
jgi:parallel beta-helix repeat protein